MGRYEQQKRWGGTSFNGVSTKSRCCMITANKQRCCMKPVKPKELLRQHKEVPEAHAANANPKTQRRDCYLCAKHTLHVLHTSLGLLHICVANAIPKTQRPKDVTAACLCTLALLVQGLSNTLIHLSPRCSYSSRCDMYRQRFRFNLGYRFLLGCWRCDISLRRRFRSPSVAKFSSVSTTHTHTYSRFHSH